MSGIGHNRGPSLEPGRGFRTHAWRQARAALMPKLPVEVVRLHVRRAKALGLDYRTYAGIRATTGRDLIAFLYSANALGMARPGAGPAPAPVARAAVSAASALLAAPPPLDPREAAIRCEAAGLPLRAAGRVPVMADGPRAAADLLGRLARGLPRDAVLVVGAAPPEAEWVAAGRFAALPARRAMGCDGVNGPHRAMRMSCAWPVHRMCMARARAMHPRCGPLSIPRRGAYLAPRPPPTPEPAP